MSSFSKKILFTGAATALVTPFTRDGSIDYPALGRMIDHQIECGIDALVLCGTTGECATLSDREHRACLLFGAERIAGRVPMIAGTGSNDTAYATALSRFAAEAGADGLLLITPYDNKATPGGLIRHFQHTADAVDLPVFLYNVPSRTGIDIPFSVYETLSRHPNIVAVKEASGDISRAVSLAAAFADTLSLYSGCDDLTVPFLSIGGRGVISVLSNLLPREMHTLCVRYFSGDTDGARREQLRLLPLIHALFCEVNPIPVKTACELLGLCSGTLRLPLCEMEASHRQRLVQALHTLGLLSNTDPS